MNVDLCNRLHGAVAACSQPKGKFHIDCALTTIKCMQCRRMCSFVHTA